MNTSIVETGVGKRFVPTGFIYAYNRCSTTRQRTDRGNEIIKNFCEERGLKLAAPIYEDKWTGKTFNRERYIVLKEDILRFGDVLLVSEMDRFGRNKREILKELSYFKEKGVRVMIIELPTTTMDFDFDNEINRLIFETIQDMLISLYSMLAEQEVKRKEFRTRIGIQQMKERGEWDRYGRPHAVTNERFAEVFEKVLRKEIRPCDAMREMQISSPTYYRYKKQYFESKGEKVS